MMHLEGLETGEQDDVLVSSLTEELRTEWKEGRLSEYISWEN